MDILVMIAQLITSLSILVILHELGHFIPAKLFGTRVDKFYLFFDPWFSLFKYKKGDTEYGIGWLPLGGYVKIAGMVDESMDKEFMDKEPQPWEFRSKPAWQRLIIMIGGVTVNFILGFLILGLIMFYYGDKYIANDAVTNGIAVSELGRSTGLQNGDKILQIGSEPFVKFNGAMIAKSIILDNVNTLKVERGGQQVDIKIPAESIEQIKANNRAAFTMVTARVPADVAAVAKGTPAEAAGIKADDRILTIAGTEVRYFDNMAEILANYKGKNVEMVVRRDNQDVVIPNVGVTTEGKLGVFPYSEAKYLPILRQHYSLGEALPAGFSKGFNLLKDQLSGFGKMFKGEIKASENLGGFATMTKLFPTEWVWEDFWRITALISLILGFMNILPIPALDGGYIMFLIWEVITGKKVSEKVMEKATMVGMLLLFGLMIYANGLDIFRAFK